MTGSARVLVLTHEPPLPAVSGGRVRDWNLIRQLHARGWSPALFAVTGAEPPGAPELAQLRELCSPVVLRPHRRRSAANLLRVAGGIATGRPFQRTYFYSSAGRREVERLLAAERFDAILCSQLYMHPYVPAAALTRAALDCHNSELARIRSMAEAEGGGPRALVARLQIGPVGRYERRAAGEVARVLAVSEPERQYFERLAPGRVELIPNGVDCDRIAPVSGPGRDLLFLGSLDYSANADALVHLVRDILPALRSEGVTVNAVGGGAASDLLALQGESAVPLRFAGRVPDTAPCFAAARAMVAPLRFGGGTRLKILEALARGVPVISTGLGAEGLGLVDGEDVLLADDPASFARATDRLLADDELWHRLSASGRRTAEERFDWPPIGAELDRVLRELAGR